VRCRRQNAQETPVRRQRVAATPRDTDTHLTLVTVHGQPLLEGRRTGQDVDSVGLDVEVVDTLEVVRIPGDDRLVVEFGPALRAECICDAPGHRYRRSSVPVLKIRDVHHALERLDLEVPVCDHVLVSRRPRGRSDHGVAVGQFASILDRGIL